MASAVYLHIGAMKSGTSFIQQTLTANKDLLAGQGVLFPGAQWRDQVMGVYDVLGRTRDGVVAKGSVGAWQRLVDEIAAWDGPAVISVEMLGAALEPGIEKVVGSLAPTEVQIVLTVRDLGRTVPAMWQESMQNRHTWGWDEYIAGVAKEKRGRNGPAKSFWRHQETVEMARRWSDAVPEGHFTLVTLPHPGAPSTVLWARFCEAIDLDPEAAPNRAERRNDSLGAASALVLRELNVALEGSGVTWPQYSRIVKAYLAKTGMAARKADEPTIGFDARWLKRRSGRMIEEFGRLPIRVIGDLEELRPVPVRGVSPSKVSDREQLDAAVAALAHMVTRTLRDRR